MKAGKTLGVVGLLVASSCADFCCSFNPDDCRCAPFGCPPDAGCFDQPEGTAALNFTIDATARPGVYANEDLEWKGAFVFDKTTRMLTYDGSWTGPYAGLWDDGPWTEGTAPNCGHEPIGSVAGDDKFGITAFMTCPTTDVTIEYGAQMKAGGWIWTGSNGSVTVPANSCAPVTLDGLTLAAPGTTDLKLMLDTNNLGSGFTYTPGQPVEVKGQMSYWLEDPAYDDGTHGDTTASDGIFTYTLSLNDVPRIKPAAGYVEFIWVINNVEYKTPGGACEQTGVSAEINTGTGWIPVVIENCRIQIP
jgi:hypothetical protein